MRAPNFSKETRHLGRAWFAVPVSILAAFVAALVIVTWPEAAGAPGDVASTEALAAQPYGGAGYPVPSAASVFTERRHEVDDHVDTF